MKSTRFLLYTAAFFLGLIAALFALRTRTVPLTAEVLTEAKARWESAALRHYDLSYRMHGVRYDVRVRDDAVTEVRVDGQALHAADPQVYSMRGLLELLGMEYDNARHAQPRPTLRVCFDPDDGRLVRYVRGRGGMGRGTSIETLSFTPTRSPAGPP